MGVVWLFRLAPVARPGTHYCGTSPGVAAGAKQQTTEVLLIMLLPTPGRKGETGLAFTYQDAFFPPIPE